MIYFQQKETKSHAAIFVNLFYVQEHHLNFTKIIVLLNAYEENL